MKFCYHESKKWNSIQILVHRYFTLKFFPSYLTQLIYFFSHLIQQVVALGSVFYPVLDLVQCEREVSHSRLQLSRNLLNSCDLVERTRLRHEASLFQQVIALFNVALKTNKWNTLKEWKVTTYKKVEFRLAKRLTNN